MSLAAGEETGGAMGWGGGDGSSSDSRQQQWWDVGGQQVLPVFSTTEQTLSAAGAMTCDAMPAGRTSERSRMRTVRIFMKSGCRKGYAGRCVWANYSFKRGGGRGEFCSGMF
jgi:hypothetical protein